MLTTCFPASPHRAAAQLGCFGVALVIVVGAPSRLDHTRRAGGRLLPGLKLSLRDELTALFDAVDEDYIALLEDRIAKLEEQLKGPVR
jgi:hypothetical protein